MTSKILITGGTGTLGKALTRELLRTDVEQIRIFSRDEYKQERMYEEIQDDRIRFLLGDVRDRGRLGLACRGVDSVIHTAALKVVPWLEFNPMECNKTNVQGTENVAEVCDSEGVKNCIYISTDKAVNPCNIYGHSKAMGERIMLDFNNWSTCAFSVIRFGNLIGSRGSVVEKWGDANLKGEPILVTDWDMVRYWISPQQAARCILEVIKRQTPSIYIPEMQEISLRDIFEQMHLDKRKVKMIGSRPGEKLKEDLYLPNEVVKWLGGCECKIKLF